MARFSRVEKWIKNRTVMHSVYVFEMCIESDVEREWGTSIKTSANVFACSPDLRSAATKFEVIHETSIECDCAPQLLVTDDDIVPMFADKYCVAKLELPLAGEDRENLTKEFRWKEKDGALL